MGVSAHSPRQPVNGIKRAGTASSQESYKEAVRYYARAISFMMEELRKQREKNANHSDSSIDLI